MIMTYWVVMMDLVMVLASVVPMGLWLVWWMEAMLGMGNDIAGGNQVDDMVLKMMVLEMAGWMECMLDTEWGVVVGQVMVKVWLT